MKKYIQKIRRGVKGGASHPPYAAGCVFLSFGQKTHPAAYADGGWEAPPPPGLSAVRNFRIRGAPRQPIDGAKKYIIKTLRLRNTICLRNASIVDNLDIEVYFKIMSRVNRSIKID